MEYQEFIKSKKNEGSEHGFDPLWIPDFLYDFQRDIVTWAVRKGRAAIFADCGLGKTPMQLVWAENIVRKTNGNVLIIAPLAVSAQTKQEADKFGIEIGRSKTGQVKNKITITNYERLESFNSNDFSGVVCDESSILKNFNGKRRQMITEFLKKVPYRLLCTATAAPNDYVELGTSSEALGNMGFMDMLGRFFKNNQSNCALKTQYRQMGEHMPQWRFKYHAEEPFWRWVSSWARAIRKPSDFGYDDGDFILPELIEKETVIPCSRPLNGKMFVEPAYTLSEQREERRATIEDRCEFVSNQVNGVNTSLIWCHLNDEGKMLEKIIPDSMQVKGSDSEEKKEETFMAFSNGDLRVLITKPRIGAFGMNWQHCSHVSFFPSHSYEQYYQSVRRCWRFGQKSPVVVDIVTTEGEYRVLKNLKRKAKAADKMFTDLMTHMNNALEIKTKVYDSGSINIPAWIRKGD